MYLSAYIIYEDIKGILHEMRVTHVQSIVRKKCGNLAARVFKLLIIHKRLQEQQVCVCICMCMCMCMCVCVSMCCFLNNGGCIVDC